MITYMHAKDPVVHVVREFGGLRKHDKTQHAVVGLGSAALAAAAALPRIGGPNFPKGIIKCIKKKKTPFIHVLRPKADNSTELTGFFYEPFTGVIS